MSRAKSWPMRARRLHAAARQQFDPCHQCQPLREDRLRSGKGFRADQPDRHAGQYSGGNPNVPAHSMAELIALAKANPGKLNFASSGYGVAAHLAGELFKTDADIDIVHVPYKGAAPALAGRHLRTGPDDVRDHLGRRWASSRAARCGRCGDDAQAHRDPAGYSDRRRTRASRASRRRRGTAWSRRPARRRTSSRTLHRAVIEALNDPEVRQSLDDARRRYRGRYAGGIRRLHSSRNPEMGGGDQGLRRSSRLSHLASSVRRETRSVRGRAAPRQRASVELLDRLLHRLGRRRIDAETRGLAHRRGIADRAARRRRRRAKS